MSDGLKTRPAADLLLSLIAALVVMAAVPACAQKKTKLAASSRDRAGIAWVAIPGGTFMMGSEDESDDGKPVHRVTVRPFQMAKTPVTVKQYNESVQSVSGLTLRKCGRTTILPPLYSGR